mmetsp:Transcript_19189/g.47938  ORF Transcript_19189/g.47938 Transcript_19189/m.47938 type:complete len:278 (+) Transcript_19189:249-1082(+)
MLIPGFTSQVSTTTEMSMRRAPSHVGQCRVMLPSACSLCSLTVSLPNSCAWTPSHASEPIRTSPVAWTTTFPSEYTRSIPASAAYERSTGARSSSSSFASSACSSSATPPSAALKAAVLLRVTAELQSCTVAMSRLAAAQSMDWRFRHHRVYSHCSPRATRRLAVSQHESEGTKYSLMPYALGLQHPSSEGGVGMRAGITSGSGGGGGEMGAGNASTWGCAVTGRSGSFFLSQVFVLGTFSTGAKQPVFLHQRLVVHCAPSTTRIVFALQHLILGSQ